MYVSCMHKSNAVAIAVSLGLSVVGCRGPVPPAAKSTVPPAAETAPPAPAAAEAKPAQDRSCADATERKDELADSICQTACARGSEDACAQVCARARARASSGMLEDQVAAVVMLAPHCKRGFQPACDAKKDLEVAIFKKGPETVDYEGTLLSKVGDVIRVKLTGKAEPAIGANAELLRLLPQERPELDLFPGSRGTKAWLRLAITRVDQVDKGVAVVTLLKEESAIAIKGKQANLYTPGVTVKFTVAAGP